MRQWSAFGSFAATVAGAAAYTAPPEQTATVRDDILSFPAGVVCALILTGLSLLCLGMLAFRRTPEAREKER